jgi:hypothetical protein
MTLFYGPNIPAWNNLHQSIEVSSLRDLSIRQTGDNIGEIIFLPTVPEYRDAAGTDTEMGIHIANTSTHPYTLVVTLRRWQWTLEFEGLDSRNAVLLIKKILTGEGDMGDIILTNVRYSNHDPPSPPRMSRQPNTSPATVRRPTPHRPP